MAKILLVFFAALMFSVSAFAGRNLPANVQVGDLQGIQPPLAQISNKTYRLTAATKIYGTNNLILVPYPAGLSGPAAFTLDAQGFLGKVWMLTPEEVAKFKK